jgi:hypothetical protein
MESFITASRVDNTYQNNDSRFSINPQKDLRKEDSIDPVRSCRLNFEKFVDDLKELFNKNKFRKCLDDIADKENIFLDMEDKWKITDIKVKCMVKIIDKKFAKYIGTKAGEVKLKSVEEWLKKLDDEVGKWSEGLVARKLETRIDPPDFMIQFEMCIRVSLFQCYSNALYARNEKLISDCAAYLALGERLIVYSSDFTNDPESLNMSCKILLFISSLLIADKDFETAKNYISNSMRLNYKELNYRMDMEEGINFSSLTKSEQISLEKTFLNLVTGFYQLGVCEENLGNMITAADAYKQANWFSKKFLNKDLPELDNFIHDVHVRAKNYLNLILTVKNNQHTYKEPIKNDKKNRKPKIYYDEFNNVHKYDNIIKKIENLKLEDIEEDETIALGVKKSENIKHIMSTVKIINHFMSDDFRVIIKNMDKIEVSKFDKEIKEKIQKKVNEIKAEQIYQEKEQIRKTMRLSMIKENKDKELKTEDNNSNLRESKDIKDFKGALLKDKVVNYSLSNLNSSYFPNSNFLNSPKSRTDIGTIPCGSTNESIKRDFSTRPYTGVSKNISGSLNLLQNISSNTPRNFFSPSSPVSMFSKQTASRPKTTKNSASTRNNLDVVKKFNLNEFVFDKSFRSKMSYLDKISSREFDFQKKMLKVKKYEKLIVEDYDHRKVTDTCEKFFHNMLTNKTKHLKDDENLNKKKEILNEENFKKEKEKEKLETKVLQSLSTKAYVTYLNFKKTMNGDPKVVKSRKQSTHEINKESTSNVDKNLAHQKNMDIYNKLETQIQNIDKMEEFLKQELHPYSVAKKTSLKKTCFNIKLDSDNFIKRTGQK